MKSKVVMLLFNDLKGKFRPILLFVHRLGSGRQRLSALYVHSPLSDVPKHGREADVLSFRRICYHIAHKLPSILRVTVDRWLVLGITCSCKLDQLVVVFWSGPTMSSLDG